MMKIIDIEGQHMASSVEDVEAILQRRLDSNVNAFYLSYNDHEFPMLSILVNNDVATLNFLERTDEAGFIPVGNLPNFDAKEDTVFCLNRNPADDVEVPNNSVVSFSTALDAAKEFFKSRELPKCVEWVEL
jgi:hypothetical protein